VYNYDADPLIRVDTSAATITRWRSLKEFQNGPIVSKIHCSLLKDFVYAPHRLQLLKATKSSATVYKILDKQDIHVYV
jgi:hypothetical protein